VDVHVAVDAAVQAEEPQARVLRGRRGAHECRHAAPVQRDQVPGQQAQKSYGWDAEADRGHFVVAYPDGLDRAWNTGGCCGTPGRANADDIGFITAMVSAIERELPVDANRVYATGISNGGIMAYTLACHTTIFAAIGPDSATELGGCPAPAPLSVIHIHGTADKNIPYQGGEGDGVAHIDGPPVAGRYAQPAGPAALAHRPAIHGAERHAGHLAVLRRAPALNPPPGWRSISSSGTICTFGPGVPSPKGMSVALCTFFWCRVPWK
jgi:Esterase PHB depolymerase